MHLVACALQYVNQPLMLLFLLSELVLVSCCRTVSYLYDPDCLHCAAVFIKCNMVPGSAGWLWLSVLCVCEQNVWSQLCSICPSA